MQKWGPCKNCVKEYALQHESDRDALQQQKRHVQRSGFIPAHTSLSLRCHTISGAYFCKAPAASHKTFGKPPLSHLPRKESAKTNASEHPRAYQEREGRL